ncbi:MAG: hypothetical protein MUO67_21000 [Anaerolineales bacterium]|nr:hypothetical protein [Anaerolineales bacterium]
MNFQQNIHLNVPQITILADDLTGAADAGGFFGDLGLTTIVRLEFNSSYAGDALILNTHSRHLSQEEACQQNISAVQSLCASEKSPSSVWIYKKIDSTLRGHPFAELRAIMEQLNYAHALVAPAFPDQGRTTVNGRQLVYGQPLEYTHFKDQVPSSSLQALFSPNTSGRQIKCINLSLVREGVESVKRSFQGRSPSIFIADAETEGDLRTLAKAAVAENIHLLCGSAGLSRALGQVLSLRSSVPAPGVPTPKEGPILIVAGSCHPATHRQIECASRSGTVVLSPTSLDTAAAQSVAFKLSQGQDVLLSTEKIERLPAHNQKIAQSLGWITGQVTEKVEIGGLVLTGGDTAQAVLQSLECSAIWLHGEIEPGIPRGQLLGGSQSGLPLVTKAGGFGSDRSLSNALSFLKKN